MSQSDLQENDDGNNDSQIEIDFEGIPPSEQPSIVIHKPPATQVMCKVCTNK